MLLNIFKKAPQQVVSNPSEEVRKELFDAITNNNLTLFEELCEQHKDLIAGSFQEWNRIPGNITPGSSAAQQYSYCLKVMTGYFQRENSRAGGAPQSGLPISIEDWKGRLGASRELMSELKFEEALAILEQLPQSGNFGFAEAELLHLTLGNTGECYFQLGRVKQAISPMTKALTAAMEQNHDDAQFTYMRNLYEIYRYLDHGQEAAKHMRQMEQKLLDRTELVHASNWRHQARVVDVGEPPLRVVLKIGDEFFELDEIPVVNGLPVEFIFMRNKIVLRPSSRLCEVGQELAQSGNFEEALATFEQAVAADSSNPAPHYFSAAIHVHRKNYQQAVEAYERAESICPGLESCREELWLARKLASGEYERDAYTGIRELKNEEVSVEARIAAGERLLQKYPRFAETHFELGKLMAFTGFPAEAINLFQQGLSVVDDPDVKTRLLRDLAVMSEAADESAALLLRATEMRDGNLLAIATCHYLLAQLDLKLS